MSLRRCFTYFIMLLLSIESTAAQPNCADFLRELDRSADTPKAKRLELRTRVLSSREGYCYNGCWIDSNLNRLEILLSERANHNIQLSSAYLVMNDLLMQADRIASLQGPKAAVFNSGGESVNFSELVTRVGLIPEEVMPQRPIIRRWLPLVRDLNKLSADFFTTLEEINGRYHFKTFLGLVPAHINKQASEEISQKRILFRKVATDKIYEVFGRPQNEFYYAGKSWSPKEFSEHLMAEANSTTRFIDVSNRETKESGLVSSAGRYADAVVAAPIFRGGKFEKVAQIIVSFLKAGEPVPAVFYMAYNHLNGDTKTFSFRDSQSLVQKSIFDNVHAMTIVGYETGSDGFITRWIVRNNVESDNRIYYFNQTALQKLLLRANFPFGAKNLDYIRAQLDF